MKVPKYYRVKRRHPRADRRTCPPAHGVPTERELAERFETSRTTVRQAIAELVVDGRLERTQGRGTFVAQPKLMQVRQLTSFSQDPTTRDGSRAASCWTSTNGPPTPNWPSHLAVAPGTPSIASSGYAPRLTNRSRTRSPTSRGPLPALAEELAERGSLYRTMREAYGIDLAAVEDIVETALADPVSRDLLEVDTGLPMLLVHRTGWDDSGRVVEWTRSRVPRRPVPVCRQAATSRHRPPRFGRRAAVSLLTRASPYEREMTALDRTRDWT